MHSDHILASLYRMSRTRVVLEWPNVRTDICGGRVDSWRAPRVSAGVAGPILHAKFHQCSGVRRHLADRRRQSRSQLSTYATAIRRWIGSLAHPARQRRRPAGDSRCARGQIGYKSRSSILVLLSASNYLSRHSSSHAGSPYNKTGESNPQFNQHNSINTKGRKQS